jgi:hypothetical protein
MKQKIITYSIVIFLVALVFALPTIAQQTACYGAQGGTLQTAASGCEYEFQSGSILDVQAGATVSLAAAVSSTGGQSVSPNLVVVGATAQAASTPIAYINNAGAHNNFVIAKNATPVFTVGNSGAVSGQVLSYATTNQRQFCATNTITDTASYTATVTAVSTPVFTWCALEEVTGDASHCGANFGATANITITVKNSAATPAANAAGADVTWCVIGTPQ